MTAVDWTTLRHAYGVAGDIPALFARAWIAPTRSTFLDADGDDANS